MNPFGFVRVTCVSPWTTVAAPRANADAILQALGPIAESDIVLFPELCVTGYSCADLFGQAALLNAADRELSRLAEATAGRRQLVVVGAPVAWENGLYNCAVALSDGAVLGAVPKRHLPNSREFYERRWFRPAPALGAGPLEVVLGGRSVPFGADLLFEARGGPGETSHEDVIVGIEICEDLWVPTPPSAEQALAGAAVLLNLSASNETIGKATYRAGLVVCQSGRCVAAYAMAGQGPSESTTDLVFSGHCLIAENGALLAESPRVGDGDGDGRPARREGWSITADVDLARLKADRRALTSFGDERPAAPAFRRVAFDLAPTMDGLKRTVSGAPFVPAEGPELHRRCAEVFGIQRAGLARRIEQLPEETPLNIGISGGLDSTLALLVAVAACDLLGRDRSTVHGLTMPGFGTTRRTRSNALDLMAHLGVASETLDIRELALQTFRELGHAPFGIDCAGTSAAAFQDALAKVPRGSRRDLTFENVQARLRTFLLMSRGFVVGTGDLSELALGWCTYNGDHMSMYNVNCSVPKTLVKFLVKYVAMSEHPEGPVRRTLLSIAETTISPELLPPSPDGEIEQSTEEALGAFELHDFALYHMVRGGASPEKVRFLAGFAEFSRPYAPEVIDQTLRTFIARFFQNQFKRSCVPDGPKVGTVSLSPRGDWRMPSDASPMEWLR